MAEGGHNTSQTDTKMDALELLLERTRNERQNELLQIQNNTRPVTGQASRNNIGQFMAKNIEVREIADASGKENVPLNSRNVEEHRPDAVVIEISNISQQQRVSSVLQAAGFRRQLENIIRGSIRNVSQSRSQSGSHRATPSPSSTPVRAQTPVGDSPLIAPLQSLPERRDSVSSQVTSATSSSTSLREFSNAPVDVRVQDPRGLLGSVLQHDNVSPSGLAIPTGPVVHEVNWHTIEEQQQEELIQEVSELLHRRLVTSTLQGEFRNILELHVQQQLAATGTDGQRVEQFIRSIPQTQPHQHNDFSNLGIPVQGENNWDNISVTSISASAVPYTQTNLHLSREISALKAQLLEMKNMMKISFDLQMDIQRSIRQEVAAGIAAASGGAIGSAGTAGILPTATAALSRPVNDTHCLICLDNHSDSVLYQCGHMCVCFPCGRHLMDRGAKCPVCRAPIRDIIRAYKCNSE
ncbi:uncharacterized protein LOC127843164 [Dreissena polymorpha]|uniref:RING-type domain-containing protein n=1 Tax=Dreissena polymorpha TaxID=45954 RepID=A0A9D4IVM5_DREPO|nr:uncharacterized protein LOC127843164 [Dreissena polymorpha]KAH3786559.1 hypothetical protein DPMN_164666 [Dreissena polymorpha]